MKVVVLGASSFSTPHLVRYLAGRDDIAPLTLVLAGRTPERISPVGRAARILAEGSPLRIETLIITEDQRACLAGAAVVLVQVRVGGYQARGYDETFPLEFDLCGDEGLGPGGLAAAWRTWPVLRGILSEVSVSCPTARVVLLTSPLTMLVRMSRVEFPGLNVTGICELPFTTLCGAGRSENLQWTEMEWQYIGINHIGWLYGMRGGPIPLKYLRLQNSQAEVLAEQKAQPGARAAELAWLLRPVMDTYAHGNRDQIERALKCRPAQWYDAAAGPLVAFYAGGEATAVFFLSLPRALYSPEFACDDVLEVPHVPAGSCLVPRPNTLEPPAEAVEILAGFLRYERAAAQAVLARDCAGIEHALSLHPWITGAVPLATLASRVCATLPDVREPT